MSAPDATAPSRPAKAAGFALLGVAAVALVIGIVSLFSGGQSETPPPVAQSTSATPTSESSAAPTSSSSSSEAPTTTTTPPPTTTSAPPVTTTAPPVAGKSPVRVYNNSTITGLAARASEDVKKAGYEVTETGNYSQGQIPTTTVYYRPGTDEEASAKALAAAIKARVEPRFDGIQNSAAGVILIVTNDYKGSAPK